MHRMRALVLGSDRKVKLTQGHPKPTPGEKECLVRVTHAGVCSTDLELIRGYMDFAGVLGHEFVGVVEQSPDTRQIGRRVVCEINCVCGKCDMCLSGLRNHCRSRTVIGIDGRDGAFADYIAVPVRNCHPLPDSISDEAAVFVEPIAAAVQVIRQVPIDTRMKVTVLGDGRLGQLVAQVLQTTGCGPCLVGKHSTKLAIADRLDIRTELLGDAAADKRDDLVVDCTGSSNGFETAMRMVRPRGIIVLKSTHAGAEPINLAPLVVDEVQLIGSRCGPFGEAIDLLARGQVDVTGLISRRFNFDKAEEGLEAAANAIKVIFTM
jgi:threonine dehydrogenase-like Zn-dependent dehydrogenase